MYRVLERALLLLLLLTPPVFAELALTEENFAFTAKIGAGKQSLRQFELPYEVLQAIQRQDYADIQVFNSQNQIVPFSVTVKKPQLQQSSNNHELDFFTLPKNSQHHTRLQIEIDKYRHHFNVSTVPDEKDKLSYIIIKNFYSDQGLDKLKLAWNKSLPSFSLKLKLEQSDDLEHWIIVKQQTTLYNLKQSSTQLIKDTIDLSKKSYASYFRISFTNRTDFLYAVSTIRGYSYQNNRAEFKNWKTLVLKPGEVENEWLFNTESRMPVAKIAFEIPQTGLLYQGTLYSKSNVKNDRSVRKKRVQFRKEVKKILHYSNRNKPKKYDGWQYRQSFTQYQLLNEAGEINSQAMLLSGVKDSQWRMVLKQPLTLLAEQIPMINIAWYPVVVTFLAQGNEPYHLHFGQTNINKLAQSHSLQSLTGNLIETVKLGAINEVEKQNASIGLESTLSGEFKKINWPKILLWLLLCLFVLLMMNMTYKLYKSMNKQ